MRCPCSSLVWAVRHVCSRGCRVAEAYRMKLAAQRHALRIPSGGGMAALLLLVLWQGAALALGHDALAGPVPAVQRLFAILTMPRYRADLSATVFAFMIALALSWTGGLLLAAWFGMRKLAGEVAEPLLVSFYA